MRNWYIRFTTTALIILSLGWIAPARAVQGSAQKPPLASESASGPPAVGMSPTRLAHLDEIIEAEVAKKQLPGAVVIVGRKGKVVWRRAYGNRALEPAPEPMTVDTIFDLASLTKVVATATSMMILVERGLVRLGDPVSRYIPEFGESGKKNITVEQLLTHRSGLIADNDVKDYEQGPEEAMRNIWKLAPLAEAGSKFIYSDVNYIVLAELVKRVSGKPVDQFASENIFRPLGMKDTGYKPDASLTPRIAPTEKRGEKWMRGEVHDPRAYLLGGVAGHAGLFSTADDLAIYCQMILNRGEFQGARVLSPMGVARMTEARPTGGNAVDGAARGIGWDIFTGYSANRGDLFPVGSFGHTGFTGTGLWIDPSSETFVVFLSNRVHPKLDPNNGIDVLKRDGFALLKDKRVGLITNHTGRDRDGDSTIDLFHKAPGVKLVALFSPEHGIRGALDQSNISNSTDEKTGLPIYSLYGETKAPTAEMLKEIDTLVFDIQDVGARFYTYISTLGLALEAAAKNKKSFVVLDRVNPINGQDVEGPLADPDKLSFTAPHPIPIRHGMTAGELALLFNKERNINADLHVVRVEDWRRSQWFDSTGLAWINPSPNMRSLTEATLYPGVCLLEPTNVSVGRGTDTPFEVIGAPWIDGRKLAEALNNAKLPGVRFVPVRFTPKSSVHKDAECAGVNIIVTNRDLFEPVITGLEMAAQLRKLFPKDFLIDRFNRLLANQKVFDAFRQGSDARAMRQVWESELDAFRAIRSKYLLY